MKWEKEYGKDVWRLESKTLRISVVRGHINNPDNWTMHCPELRMDTVDIGLPNASKVDLAQVIAVNLVGSKLKEMYSDLSKAATSKED
jgi:hypothetical protein